MTDRLAVDAVVLDIDGVLVDVSDSYRRAIVETVERVHGEAIDRTTVQRFKDAGGFNNDWDLTYAAALFVLARQEGLSMDVGAFTDAISATGGGLSAAETVVADALGPAARERVLAAWDRERLHRTFQQLYLGTDRYREFEGGEPTIECEGYVHDEPVIADESTIRALTDGWALAVLTGRPAAEAQLALDRVGLSVPDTLRMTMDDTPPGKPDPAGLTTLADRLGSGRIAFVGDTGDDVRTAGNAAAADPDRTYHGIGVLTGGAGRRSLERAGADLVLESVNELPEALA